MIEPEPVERDQYGFWYHSALCALGEEQPIHELPAAAGMEFKYAEFFEDAPEDLRQLYEDASSLGSSANWEDAVKAWQPSAPEGGGWFLLAVYDTEDGPYACFTQPAQPAGAQAPPVPRHYR